MRKCPVCEKESEYLLCPDCGFDGSLDYERHPTVVGLPCGTESVFRLKAVLQEKSQQSLSDELHCPGCGGNRFSFGLSNMCLACPDCGKKTPMQQLLAFHDAYIERTVKNSVVGQFRGCEAEKRAEKAANAPQPQAKSAPIEWKHAVGKRIAIAKFHTAFLRADGTVAAAGRNLSNQCDVQKWKNIISVAVGSNFTLGLEKTGTVVVAGDAYDQHGVKNWTNISSIATGANHTVGLTRDGTVVCAGKKQYGQCELNGHKNIASICAGNYHTVAVRKNGTVVAAGVNGDGECAVQSWKEIVAAAAGRYHTVGLRKNGTVIATGLNSRGQCDVADWKNMIAVAAGAGHTVGLRKDGTVIATGANEAGQCKVGLWRDIVEIAAGDTCTMGLRKDGKLLIAGSNNPGAFLAEQS